MKTLKRLFCITLSLLMLASAYAVPARAADFRSLKTGVAVVDATSLRLRSAASTSSATLDYARDNEVVVVLGKTGSWYHVLFNLTEGYMHEDYLDVSTVRNVELGIGRVNYPNVNMRTGPSTGYTSLGKSSKGDSAYIIGINKQWYKVIWNGMICYIRSDYLTLTEAPYENRASAKSPIFFRNGKSSGTPVSPDAINGTSSTSSRASAIIATAKKYIGSPYLWGGTTPSGFDCSGFVQYVFKKHGISLNRTCATQYRHGSFVSKANLKPGDLVFFQNTYKAGISHIGIYIGSNQFIHCSSSRGVTISNLSSSYYVQHYYGARRVL